MGFNGWSQDARHKKTDLKVFVVVIPKEGWAHVAVPILLLAWHRLFENITYDVSRVKFWKVGVIPKEGWARPCAPILLLVWQRLRPLGIFLHDGAHMILLHNMAVGNSFHNHCYGWLFTKAERKAGTSSRNLCHTELWVNILLLFPLHLSLLGRDVILEQLPCMSLESCN